MFMGRKKERAQSAFTLIELLIVIAIIAILALIAIPNFLEAQIRAKTSRALADMRAIASGLEAYMTDNQAYPHLNVAYTLVNQYPGKFDQWNRDGIALATNLTTPIAYLSTVYIFDPFFSLKGRTPESDAYVAPLGDKIPATYSYFNIKVWPYTQNDTYPGPPSASTLAFSRKHWASYLLLSVGPDMRKGPNPADGSNWNFSYYGGVGTRGFSQSTAKAWEYDPTNGTMSKGDILSWH